MVYVERVLVSKQKTSMHENYLVEIQSLGIDLRNEKLFAGYQKCYQTMPYTKIKSSWKCPHC